MTLTSQKIGARIAPPGGQYSTTVSLDTLLHATGAWYQQELACNENNDSIRKSIIGSNIDIEVNEFFTHFGLCFETIHDVAASQL